MGDAEIDLAPRVRVEVEPGPALLDRQRVGARGDGLHLECLRQPVARHLRRDDPVEVGLEPDDVDRAQGPVRNGHLHLAAVRAVAEPEGRRAGVERERSGQLLPLGDVARLDPQPRPEGLRARSEVPELADPVAHAERRQGRDRQPRLALREEHAHLGHGRLPDGRALVVVGEDVVVRPALLRVAVRAPLGHAHSVAPPSAADHEDGRAGKGLRRGLCAVLEEAPARTTAATSAARSVERAMSQ